MYQVKARFEPINHQDTPNKQCELYKFYVTEWFSVVETKQQLWHTKHTGEDPESSAAKCHLYMLGFQPTCYRGTGSQYEELGHGK